MFGDGGGFRCGVPPRPPPPWLLPVVAACGILSLLFMTAFCLLYFFAFYSTPTILRGPHDCAPYQQFCLEGCVEARLPQFRRCGGISPPQTGLSCNMHVACGMWHVVSINSRHKPDDFVFYIYTCRCVTKIVVLFVFGDERNTNMTHSSQRVPLCVPASSPVNKNTSRCLYYSVSPIANIRRIVGKLLSCVLSFQGVSCV